MQYIEPNYFLRKILHKSKGNINIPIRELTEIVKTYLNDFLQAIHQ